MEKYPRMLNITPGKVCGGGPYMLQGSSLRVRQCDQVSCEERQKYKCNRGYTGMKSELPKYTPLSNHMWENERVPEYERSRNARTHNYSYIKRLTRTETDTGLPQWMLRLKY